MTTKDLEDNFKTHIDQIPILVQAKADWALLHYIIMFPSICSALEKTDGQSDGNSYIDWANRYLADQKLNGDEWYNIRCLLLHQGITKSSPTKSRYTFYRFKSPINTTHKEVQPDNSILLDVHAMKDELLAGLSKWFADVVGTKDATVTQNVQNNIQLLSKVITISNVAGTAVSTTHGYSISGTVNIQTSSSQQPPQII